MLSTAWKSPLLLLHFSFHVESRMSFSGWLDWEMCHFWPLWPTLHRSWFRLEIKRQYCWPSSSARRSGILRADSWTQTTGFSPIVSFKKRSVNWRNGRNPLGWTVQFVVDQIRHGHGKPIAPVWSRPAKQSWMRWMGCWQLKSRPMVQRWTGGQDRRRAADKGLPRLVSQPLLSPWRIGLWGHCGRRQKGI